jgi:hypothetical protein
MDYEYLRENLLAVAKISLEDGINYLDKARNYFETVDEPHLNNIYDRASATCTKYRACLRGVADELEKMDILDHPNLSKKEVAVTIREKVYGLITNQYTARIDDVDIWCCGYKWYITEAARKTYKDWGKPYWGYTCNAQNYPFPNYHIDDMNTFLSSRVLGWIMHHYGISGNLYYETTFFENVSFKDGMHLEPTDPYTNPMKYPGTNGDGYLFYPGIKYGIKGPIVSNRLMFIREAVDDYELLRILDELYQKNGENSFAVLQSLYSSIHNRTEVTIGSEEFFKTRERLLDLIISAKEGNFFA